MILRPVDKQKTRLGIVIQPTVSVTVGKHVTFTQYGKEWRWGVQERKNQDLGTKEGLLERKSP